MAILLLSVCLGSIGMLCSTHQPGAIKMVTWYFLGFYFCFPGIWSSMTSMEVENENTFVDIPVV